MQSTKILNFKGNLTANYTNWNPKAATDVPGYNCMQLLSGPLDGTWMTFECEDFIFVHALCQIKLIIFYNSINII